MIDLKQQFLVDDLSMFTLKSLLERLKRDFDGSKIFFFFSLQASYRFLISTCPFPHLDNLSTENLIPDLLTSANSI